ncbi:protein kinase domain-containing protein [Psychrobacter sp. 72-O-c]|uniref:protein kinase domain-containing protein n=1 Tax=Psychrobacter sp. 72-O-c TaxID=2774125 RepID=UPI001917D787|nr:protein kinase [Psychrobacter sp. 72-O-c]
MKNSASNSSITQASSAQQVLKQQSTPLLTALTAVLATLGYVEVCHQRISQQGNAKTNSYQGLTRAQHSQFGSVMIKWQLNSDSNRDPFDNLDYEIAVSTALNKSKLIQAQKKAESILVIAPLVLAYDTLQIEVFKQNQQLTILVMPYYKNGNLAHFLRQPLTDQQKYQLIVQVAHLITNLHDSGWLHNDIKPSNILLSEHQIYSADSEIVTPSLLLTDFALAERFVEGSDRGVNKCFDQEYSIDAAGTPAYLAPERWQGQGATQQSNIYAFGIMVYEILIGMRPFNISKQSSEPLRDWAIEHCQKPIPIPILPKEYHNYQDIVKKLLAKRVERRCKNMEEVLRDLDKL